jgi:hypothetical protein
MTFPWPYHAIPITNIILLADNGPEMIHAVRISPGPRDGKSEQRNSLLMLFAY